MDKLKQILTNSINNLEKIKIKGLPRAMILAFAGLFFLLILLFVCAWLHGWYMSDKADLAIFTSFFGQLFGPAVCGTVMIIGKALMDEDGNGIPDEWEKESEKNDKNKTS